MSRRLPDGTTMRQNLEAAADNPLRRGGGDALIGPDLPPAAEDAWRWFCELSCARGSTGFGMAPITFQDMLAWSRLTGNTPAPWEVEAIRALDGIYLSTMAEDPA